MKEKSYPESKAEETWKKGKLTYSLVRHSSGHYCGYVRFPKRPVREQGYGGILRYVAIHGGITFADEDDGGMVYGFDCAHCDDAGNPLLQDKTWLRAECERLGKAVQVAAKYEARYLRAISNKGKAKILDQMHAETAKFGAKFALTDNFGAMIGVIGGRL